MPSLRLRHRMRSCRQQEHRWAALGMTSCDAAHTCATSGASARCPGRVLRWAWRLRSWTCSGCGPSVSRTRPLPPEPVASQAIYMCQLIHLQVPQYCSAFSAACAAAALMRYWHVCRARRRSQCLLFMRYVHRMAMHLSSIAHCQHLAASRPALANMTPAGCSASSHPRQCCSGRHRSRAARGALRARAPASASTATHATGTKSSSNGRHSSCG